MSTTAPAAAGSPPKFKRSMRNYLLDSRFQLKYTGYLVGVAAAMAVALGGLIYVQSEKTVAIGNEAVQVGQEANRAGKDAVAQSGALNAKLENDAMASYGDQPALLESIKSANKVETDKINGRAAALATLEKQLQDKQTAIGKQRTQLLITLSASLTLLIVMLGLAGIVITHKIVGPVFKMKRLIRELGDGKLVVPGRLRAGDELVDLFDAFATMVEKLRVKQEKEIDLLDACIAQARASNADEQTLSKLDGLRAQMRSELDEEQRRTRSEMPPAA